MTFPESVSGWQSTWLYYKDVPTPSQPTGLPPFTLERLWSPRSLVVAPEEKEEVQMLVSAIVELVKGGVTGMDLLGVYLSRRIQPLQAHDHPRWMYPGSDDTACIHPEEVDEEMVARWLRSVTGNKDNPRGQEDSAIRRHLCSWRGQTRLSECFSLYLCRMVVLEFDSYT